MEIDIMMNQKAVTEFSSECGKAKIYVENDLPIGVFHDFLMLIKGKMVDRMVAAHKEQEEQLKAQQELPLHESEEEITSCCGGGCAEKAE